MPRRTDKTAYLGPEVTEQLLALFGTAKNAHARLGLTPFVDVGMVQRALSRPGGAAIPARAEQLILARWLEWRTQFLKEPSTADAPPERVSRAHGDYYHDAARDLLTGELVGGPPRFTLVDSPGKHLL